MTLSSKLKGLMASRTVARTEAPLSRPPLEVATFGMG